ncbi:hypothetical protein RJT34_16772 [Clitoria ternatea]|uniref:Uncharacterized protein n=1 Tax=Clitoria ternatea TaxID=43366 RepID=A0AAN9J7Q0_CLITE
MPPKPESFNDELLRQCLGQMRDMQLQFETRCGNVTAEMATLRKQPDPTAASPPKQNHLSPVDIQDRRARGLCFNYDAIYRPNHRCQARQLLLLLHPDDPPNVMEAVEPNEEPILETFPEMLEETMTDMARIHLY